MEVIKLTTATNSAAHYLREQIILGQIKTNQRLNEALLAKGLGISRPPLREAFRILEKDGLVEIRPRIGAFVRPISESDLEKTFAARSMIELKAIEILAEEQTYNLDEVQRAVDIAAEFRISDPNDSKEVLRSWQVFAGFHQKIVESCRNYHLINFYRVIGYNLARYQLMYLKIPGISTLSAEDHINILELLKSKQFDKSRMLLKEHLDRTIDPLRKKIRQKEAIE